MRKKILIFNLFFLSLLSFYLFCFPKKQVFSVTQKELRFMDFANFWLKYGIIKDPKEILNSVMRAVIKDEKGNPVSYGYLLFIYQDHIDTLKADNKGEIIFEGKPEHIQKNPILRAEKDGKEMGLSLKILELKELSELCEEKEEFHFLDLFLLPIFRDKKPEELINSPLKVTILDKERKPVPFAYLLFKYPERTDTLKADNWGEITFLVTAEHITKNPVLLPLKEGVSPLTIRFKFYYELFPKTEIYFIEVLKEFVKMEAINQPEELINTTLTAVIIDKKGNPVPNAYLILKYSDRTDSLKSDKNGEVKILVTSELTEKNPLIFAKKNKEELKIIFKIYYSKFFEK